MGGLLCAVRDLAGEVGVWGTRTKDRGNGDGNGISHEEVGNK